MKKQEKRMRIKAACEQRIKEEILFHACVTCVQKDSFLWAKEHLSLPLSSKDKKESSLMAIT